MKIVTWNINSVRLRAPFVAKFLTEVQPDILALQETKTPDANFPTKAFEAIGYTHQHFQGMKGYNGVAILSRHPFEETHIHHRVGKEDCRHIQVSLKTDRFKQPIHIHTLYIPAGGDEPDPQVNEKYKHKLDFLEEMTDWFGKNHVQDEAVITLGDFNIAPHEHDVWSHKQLRNVVSHTEPEITRMQAMLESLDWVDTGRHFVPMEEKLYTWWSYRNRDWKKSNRGRRLDHIWVTQPLKEHLKSHEVFPNWRDGFPDEDMKPSDHVPVMIELGQ